MTKQEILQVKLRMPKAAYRRIQREAERRGQTINAEILRRLDESFQKAEQQEAFYKKMAKDFNDTLYKAAMGITEHFADRANEYDKKIEKLLERKDR